MTRSTRGARRDAYLWKAHDALDHYTEFDYDEDGNLKDRWNRRQGTDRGRWEFTYDADGRPKKTTSPLARTKENGYNARGLLWTLTRQPSNVLTTFTYDPIGRIDTASDSLGAIKYGHDDANHIETVSDVPAVAGSFSSQRYLDALGRLKKYVHSDIPGIPGSGYTLEWIYLDTDRTNSNAYNLKYPDGKLVRYDFDSRGRLWKVTDWNARVTTYLYDNLGRLEWTMRPNATTRHVTYDDASQITRIDETGKLGRVIASFIYPAYWGNGQVRTETTYPLPPASAALPSTPTVTYDLDDRILAWGGSPVTHDPDGNMTSGPLPNATIPINFIYDVRNRLTSCAGVTYTYDPENTRVKVTSSGATRSWVINPANGQPLVRTVGSAKTWYVWGIGLLYEVDATETTKTYHYDRRGSTVALTDQATGTGITDTWTYGPYGERLSRTGTTDTPFQFNGFFGVQTDSNGLLYMRARYYNVETRRFISSDPVGFDAESNFYAFVNGDPISLTDPFGLSVGADLSKFGMERQAGVTIRNADGSSSFTPEQSDGAQLVNYVRDVFEHPGDHKLDILAAGLPAGRAALGAIDRVVAGIVGDAVNISGRIVLSEGDAVLAVVVDGKIIAQSGDMLLSHEAFVSRTVGTLPKGAEVVTIGKANGQIGAITSKTFHGVQLPASQAAQAAAQAAFR